MTRLTIAPVDWGAPAGPPLLSTVPWQRMIERSIRWYENSRTGAALLRRDRNTSASDSDATSCQSRVSDFDSVRVTRTSVCSLFFCLSSSFISHRVFAPHLQWPAYRRPSLPPATLWPCRSEDNRPACLRATSMSLRRPHGIADMAILDTNLTHHTTVA